MAILVKMKFTSLQREVISKDIPKIWKFPRNWLWPVLQIGNAVHCTSYNHVLFNALLFKNLRIWGNGVAICSHMYFLSSHYIEFVYFWKVDQLRLLLGNIFSQASESASQRSMSETRRRELLDWCLKRHVTTWTSEIYNINGTDWVHVHVYQYLGGTS